MEKKITDWLEKGLITKELALTLLEDVKREKAKSHKIKMNITIYTLAAILIGTGAIIFISANDWIIELLEQMASFVKILLMFFITALCFWAGHQLAYENKTFPRLGGALIVLSSLLIGATYALVGQEYNINANNSSLIFVWLISILPIAYVYKNFPVNVISTVLFVLGIVFCYMDIGIDEGLTWTIFIPLMIGVSLYSIGNIPVILKKYNNFSLSYKIVGLTPIFLMLLILICSVEHSYQLVSGYYILPIVLLMILNFVNYIKSENQSDNLLKVETVSMSGILIFILTILLIDIPEFIIMILANIAIIALIYYGFNYGYKYENQRIIILTNWFVVIYITTNYFRWGWSFMDKSLFFIQGGTVLLAIGIFLEKKRKELTGGKNEP